MSTHAISVQTLHKLLTIPGHICTVLGQWLYRRVPPARWFIDGGRTRGIPDAAARARTITVYTDVGKVVDNLGLAGTDTIAVLVVERSGRVLTSEVGGFEDQKAERLGASLSPTPSPTAP